MALLQTRLDPQSGVAISRAPGAPAPRAFDPAAPAGRAELIVVAAAALLGAVLLYLSAPHDGDFYWSDAPRHALNGVFLRDVLAAMPWRDPMGFAAQYYLQYPALTILFYPPLFYILSVPAFALFGVSHGVALGIVLAHAVALVIGMHLLARRFMHPAVALPIALLAMAAPGIALWGRQPMLEIPSMAFAVWAMLLLRRYVDSDRLWHLGLGLLLMLCAVYTKFSAIFLILAADLMRLGADPRGMLGRPRHWFAALGVALALVPGILITLRFGGANLQSLSSIPDAPVAKWTIEGWTWYARALPDLLGWPLLLVALAGLAVMLLPGWGRPGAGRRADRLLVFGWLGIGYLFFSYIDLKESRHATLILPPLLLAAGIGLTWLLQAPRRASIAAALLLAATTAWTAAYAPVPYFSGYREAATWIGRHAPPGAVVVFSGKRDGSFVFNMRANATERPDIFTVRADKLLLRVAVRRTIGVAQNQLSEAEIGALLDRVGASYVVAQPDFWTDLEVMKRFQAVLQSDQFVEVARFPVQTNKPEEDRELVIYRNRHEVAPAGSRLSVDLPIIGRSLEGNIPASR